MRVAANLTNSHTEVAEGVKTSQFLAKKLA